ncbi:MAG TPA: c-type cytochrome, partial [Verrucomicrobiales bacterium]|nr:c-type cytochrome [Verrucomicrobiales bacterium]
DMIQRELQQRDQPQAGEGLRRIVREAEDAGARAQALAMLDTLDLLDGESVMGALDDRHPGVRARALRLAAPRAKEDPRMGEAVSASLTDGDARVRLEAAAAARSLPVETAAPGLARLLLSENDVYVRAAALTAVPPHLAEVLWELAREGGGSWSTSTAALAAELTGWALEDQPEMVTAEFLTEAEERAAMAGGQALWEFRAGLAEAGRGRESQLAGSSVWLRLRALALGARELAKMDSADPALRKAGLQVAAISSDAEWLGGFLRPDNPLALQTAALDRLAASTAEETREILLEALDRSGPGLREKLVGSLLARESWALGLAERAAADAVLREALSPVQRQALREHTSNRVREAAAGIAEIFSSEERSEVAKRFAAVSAEGGNFDAGKTLFQEHCSACHRFRDVGTRVGPDLDGLTERSPEALATGIFDPNRNAQANYMVFVVELKDGRQLAGLIEEEGDTSFTVRGLDGSQQILLRREVESLRGTGRSLMPDGMEAVIDLEQFADLVAYLNGD